MASNRIPGSARVHRLRNCRCIQPRRADLLERAVGAPSFRERRSLEVHRSRIARERCKRAQVRRRIRPRQPGVVHPLRSLPVRDTRHDELRADPELLVEQRRQLTDRHAVTRGNGIHPDERLELRIEQCAFDDLAADRIRPVEHDERNSLALRGLHRERHRGHVRPRAAADFLEIVDQGVHVREHRRCRAAILGEIQRLNRDAGLAIDLVLDRHAVHHVTANAMLRREQHHELEVGMRRNQVDRQPAGTVDRGMIRYEPDALSTECRRHIREKRLETGAHDILERRRCTGSFAITRRWCRYARGRRSKRCEQAQDGNGGFHGLVDVFDRDGIAIVMMGRAAPAREGSFRSIITRMRTIAIILSLSALVMPLQRAAAQRPFYTTTGLLTLDVGAGSLRSNASRAEAPSFAVSLMATAPLVKRTKRAWIGGVRAPVLWFGNDDGCDATSASRACRNRRFTERATLFAGGAFDIRSTIFRVLVGPALYNVEGSGARVGSALHIDFGAPRLRGPTPILYFTRSFLGSEGGEAVGISSVGAGFRWVRKT